MAADAYKGQYIRMWNQKSKRQVGECAMIGKMELKLSCEGEIVYQMVSLFHGVLMEQLPEDYANQLHISQLHPYVQHLEYRDGEWYWIVCALNKKAVQIILRDTLANLEQIKIKKRDLEVHIVAKKYSEISYKELMDQFYNEDCSSYISVHFLAPTAFRSHGKYIFYPDIRCIFQSLMNKYDAAVEQETMVDKDTLEQLCENTEIIRYDLKSVSFSMEGVKIPSFIGKITIKMRGSQTMTNFANMLFRFGEYSGVGIKTSLGMGSIKILQERRRT